MSSPSPVDSEPSTPLPITPTHPFSHSHGLIEVIHDKIDVEEEAQFYEQFTQDDGPYDAYRGRPSIDAPSVFSRDIWLGDNSEESTAFARDVEISGWTSVGDKRGGAYIVYDCVVRTREGPVIHALKRYSSFSKLQSELRRTLPRDQQHLVPSLPSKSPIAKFRPSFLDRRRRMLEHWLTAVLLHPDIGGTLALRQWIME